MRILFVAPRLPYPPLKGDQMVAYHRIRALSARHDIFLLCCYEDDRQLAHIAGLEPFCKAIYPVKLPKWKSALNVACFAMFSTLPAQTLYYRSRELRRRAAEIVNTERIDLVHALMLRTAPALANLPVPLVLDLIDSMQLNLRSRLAHARGLWRFLIQTELQRVERYELQAVRQFDATVVVSAADRAMLGDSRNTEIVPLGVDIAQFRPQTSRRSADPTVIFTGNMSYEPNVTAATWFARNCWSDIKARVPSARFLIAGNAPSRSIRALDGALGIQVCGYVPSIADLINQSWIAVAPMQSGSGMQFKILEAMACGVPVVTTSIGLGDIKAKSGSELLVEDEPTRFTTAVLDLLSHPTRAAEIGNRGNAFVVANHSWEATTARLEQLYANPHPSRVDGFRGCDRPGR